MTDEEIDLLLSVDPKAYMRIDRVRFAKNLLEQGKPPNEVQNRIVLRFECSRMTAWRTVDIARDLVDPNDA